MAERVTIQDIADAIRSKNGSSDTYMISEMADAIENIPSGGGSSDVVNGIIRQYLATTGTIDANTFVEFVNDTQLSNGFTSYQAASAVLVDTNKVFVAHGSSGLLYRYSVYNKRENNNHRNGYSIIK